MNRWILLLGMSVWASAQTPTPVILTVDVENYVQYRDDVQDPSKLATNSNPTTAPTTTFLQDVQAACKTRCLTAGAAEDQRRRIVNT